MVNGMPSLVYTNKTQNLAASTQEISVSVDTIVDSFNKIKEQLELLKNT